MVNKEIAELTVGSLPLAGKEEVHVVQGGNSRQVPVAAFKSFEIVRVAATSNVVIASELENGDTLDGVTLATGDLVLLAGQSSASECGVYEVQASGAAARADGWTAYDCFPGALFSVQEGTANGGRIFKCTSSPGETIDSTSLTIVEVAATAADAAALDGEKYLTPYSASYHPGVAKAYSNLNGTGTISPRDDHNVAAYTDNGPGDYSVTIDNDMADSNFAVLSAGRYATASGDSFIESLATGVGAYRLYTRGSDGGVYDMEYVHSSVFGNLA